MVRVWKRQFAAVQRGGDNGGKPVQPARSNSHWCGYRFDGCRTDQCRQSTGCAKRRLDCGEQLARRTTRSWDAFARSSALKQGSKVANIDGLVEPLKGYWLRTRARSIRRKCDCLSRSIRHRSRARLKTTALRSSHWQTHLGVEHAKANVINCVIIDPCPEQDFNGADFLHFARFWAFVDRAEWTFFRQQGQLPTTRNAMQSTGAISTPVSAWLRASSNSARTVKPSAIGVAWRGSKMARSSPRY
jgi:hypothetical protein